MRKRNLLSQKRYYGEETLKALENFQISGRTHDPAFLKSIIEIKLACAKANRQLSRLDEATADAIIGACELAIRELTDSTEKVIVKNFPTDIYQGGAGTSIHMNINEVIANLATDLSSSVKFDTRSKFRVHPNDHVNMSQSTNDVIPSAIKLTALVKLEEFKVSSETLIEAVKIFAGDHKTSYRVGRTHLQDAVPISFEESFAAHYRAIRRCLNRVTAASKELTLLNLGGTAVGTKINSSTEFSQLAVKNLAEITEIDLKLSSDLVDSTQNNDDIYYISACLEIYASLIDKIANDIRLLGSGPKAGLGELLIPELQKGSSIMPGKSNPVVYELVNQICYEIYGNHRTISEALRSGQLELNVMLPIVAKNLYSTIYLLTRANSILAERGIKNLRVDNTRARENLVNSYALATLLNEKLGYDRTSELVKEALTSGRSLIKVLDSHGLRGELAGSRLLHIVDIGSN